MTTQTSVNKRSDKTVVYRRAPWATRLCSVALLLLGSLFVPPVAQATYPGESGRSASAADWRPSAQIEVIDLTFVSAATAEDNGPQDGVFDSISPINFGLVNNNGF